MKDVTYGFMLAASCLFLAWALAVMLALAFGKFSAADVEAACAEHGGVQQINAGMVDFLKKRVVVVCRDGVVRAAA